MKKRILVTGGLGFIGSNLVDKLIELNETSVYIADNLSTGNLSYKNNNGIYEEIDLTNESLLKKYINYINPNLIYHLAALPRIQPSFDEPISHDDANVRACISLIGACRELKNLDGIVYSSSSSIYGDPDFFPTPEESRISPLSPYALQKFTGERYLHILGERWNIAVASLRYFNVYGPRSYNICSPYNAYSSVVGIFKYQQMNKGILTITGDGKQERDFIHVFDVASANIELGKKLQENKYKSFNVGSGIKISINELASYFHCPIVYIDKRLGEANVTHANISKLIEIGWKPEMKLETAIKKGLI